MIKYFFPVYKNVNRILSKNKGFQKKLVKGTKNFLKKKKEVPMSIKKLVTIKKFFKSFCLCQVAPGYSISHN